MMFQRTKNLRLSVIKQIELEAVKYPDAISLAQGIPDFDTPLCIKRRVEKALDRGVVAKYSLAPGMPELRELIEHDLSKSGMFYDWQKEIIVTAGSIEAITATILALTDVGDEVIIPTPTYTSYQEVIRLAGCEPVFVDLDENDNWGVNMDKFREAITDKTKIILYCNPNNPTGTIYTKEQLIDLGNMAVEAGIFLISDEVYKDFLYSKEAKSNFFSLAEDSKYRENVIRVFGFSKAFAMTGWRVGYLHTDEKLAREIIKVHDSLVTCAPVISQYAAMGALEMGENDVARFVHDYEERRNLACSRLDRMSNIFDYIKPDSSYFVFPSYKKYSEKDSMEFALEILKDTHVALVPGVAFGPNGEYHLRISFGRCVDDINEAFDRLERKFL